MVASYATTMIGALSLVPVAQGVGVAGLLVENSRLGLTVISGVQFGSTLVLDQILRSVGTLGLLTHLGLYIYVFLRLVRGIRLGETLRDHIS